MPFERINIQLAVKLTDGNLPAMFYQKPTQGQLNAMADMTWIQIIKAMILKFKQYSEKVNSGLPNEENTFVAKRHNCNHDSNPVYPCVEEDI